MKLSLKNIDFSSVPAEKVGLPLLLKLYEIRSNLQNCLEEIQSLSERLKKEETKMKVKPSLINNLSGIQKEIKVFSAVISQLHQTNTSEEELKSFYEMQKILNKIPTENLKKFTGDFFEFFNTEEKKENEKSGS